MIERSKIDFILRRGWKTTIKRILESLYWFPLNDLYVGLRMHKMISSKWIITDANDAYAGNALFRFGPNDTDETLLEGSMLPNEMHRIDSLSYYEGMRVINEMFCKGNAVVPLMLSHSYRRLEVAKIVTWSIEEAIYDVGLNLEKLLIEIDLNDGIVS